MGSVEQPDLQVEANPWTAVPHLHPRLEDDQRISAQEEALFLELAMALEPGVALAYLSSVALTEGRYRFGGRGIWWSCAAIQSRRGCWICCRPPGIWPGAALGADHPGGVGLAQAVDARTPRCRRTPANHPWRVNQQGPGILTDRPRPWRFRLGSGAVTGPTVVSPAVAGPASRQLLRPAARPALAALGRVARKLVPQRGLQLPPLRHRPWPCPCMGCPLDEALRSTAPYHPTPSISSPSIPFLQLLI